MSSWRAPVPRRALGRERDAAGRAALGAGDPHGSQDLRLRVFHDPRTELPKIAAVQADPVLLPALLALEPEDDASQRERVPVLDDQPHRPRVVRPEFHIKPLADEVCARDSVVVESLAQ